MRFAKVLVTAAIVAAGTAVFAQNEDDGFSSPLLELSTFQVDYLEKNLRLVVRGGKRYDFTDPETPTTCSCSTATSRRRGTG
jgi:hypothetical protein